MLISIITATYNSEATIADTLQSVQQQSYNNIEHVIVDGLSTDQTIEIVKKHNHIGPIIQEKDKGIYDAMNKGITIATGDIIGILNSDDFYADNTIIEKVMDVFATTNCDAVYGDLVYVDANDTSKIVRTWRSGSYKRQKFLYGWMPPHPTFFVKKSVYEKFGVFNLQLWGAADYEIMLRFLYKHHLAASYLPTICVHMRSGGQSNATVANRIRANKEDRKAWEINGIKPNRFTLFLKPTRKVAQFFIKSIVK